MAFLASTATLLVTAITLLMFTATGQSQQQVTVYMQHHRRLEFNIRLCFSTFIVCIRHWWMALLYSVAPLLQVRYNEKLDNRTMRQLGSGTVRELQLYSENEQ